MEYSDANLQKLHNTLLELLDYVVKVCDDYKLQYLVIGGTTLGAYRHCGFIPWDDDLDIALPRADYEKLISILYESRDTRYSIQNERSEPNYFLPFAKLRKNGTCFREKIAPDVYQNNGIYIDIFPIDFVENAQSIRFRIRAYHIDLISHALRFRTCRAFYREGRTTLRYIYDWILYIPYSPISNKKLLLIQKKMMKKDNSKRNKYAINFASTYSWKKELFPVEVFFPEKELDFEGRKVYVHGKVEDYLEQLYGNYMQLPPEDKRHTHEPLELRF